MGVLVGIIAIIVYYALVPRFVDVASTPAFLVAVAYGFVPLVAIPLVVVGVRSTFTPETTLQTPKLVGAVAGATALALVVLSGLATWMTPGPPVAEKTDPVAEENARQFMWVQRGKEAVRAKLKDPDSAEFRDVYYYRAKDGLPVACGEVNSKNSFGGYSGFQRFLSAGSAELTYLQEQMKTGEFVKLWNKFCAGPRAP